MTQQSGPVGPRLNEELEHETRGLVQGGRSSRAEEWRDPEPAGEDQPTGDSHILPDDRRSAPPGMTPADVELRSEIARWLGRSSFPADRDTLVDHAASNQAPEAVLDRLRSLPDKTWFENMQDVARALGIGTESHRT